MLFNAQETSPSDAFIDNLAVVWWVFAVVGAMLVIVAAARYIAFRIDRRRLVRSGMDDIDRFGGKTFEMYLEAVFKRDGYVVERTRFVGDYGGDLVLRKDGVRTIVQAKRYTKTVGVKAVQEVVAAKAMYDCTEAMVVTNSHFSTQATTLSARNGVNLWDRDDLQRLLERAGDRATIQATEAPPSPPPTPSAAPLATVEACATCAKVLTAGERRYCEANERRFGGRMLCFRHQRSGRA